MPGLEYWCWVHTPGHTPGHVSLFREMDGTLLAGDALATINMDSWISQLPRKRELHRPPAPFTPDWEASRESVVRLAGLEPSVIAAGHGLPMTGRNVAEELQSYTGRFSPPRPGRYVGSPAAADEEGVKELPPVPDPLPKALAGAAVAVATGAATLPSCDLAEDKPALATIRLLLEIYISCRFT